MANDNVKELELNGSQYNMVDATARQSIDELKISTNQSIDELETSTNQSIDELKISTNQSIDELEISTNNKISSLGVHSARMTLNTSNSTIAEIDIVNTNDYSKGGIVFISTRYGQTIAVTFGSSQTIIDPSYAKAFILNNSGNKITYPLKLKTLNQNTLAIRFTLGGWPEVVFVTALGISITEVTIKQIQDFDGDETNLTPKDLTA